MSFSPQNTFNIEKEIFMDNQLNQYIIALCNLYGMVHKRKVKEIYNMQNKEKVSISDVEEIMEKVPKEVDQAWIEVYKNYFVCSIILEHKEFEYYLEEKDGKPYYIPSKHMLLRYVDSFYYEKTKALEQFSKYLLRRYMQDEERAMDLTEDMQSMCQFNFTLDQIFDRLELMGVHVQGKKDLDKMIQHILHIKNHTRIWENNGYTQKELQDLQNQKERQPLPILSTVYLGNPKKNL